MNQQQPSTVYSFDVFDTCVTRCCDRPSDLFERLFVNLLASKSLSSAELAAAAKGLARSRIAAEKLARQQTTQDDVTLTAICQVLTESLEPYDIRADEAEAAEAALELATVSPILSTRLQIQQLRAGNTSIGGSHGSKVVFISDMYLPSQVVRQMLIDHGFSDGSDAVYVSADIGLSKGSGQLFPHVCDQLGIVPKQLHHTGDNRYADVRSARRQGVKATYFKRGNPNRYERGFRAELVGDDWVRSHIIGLSRVVRLRHDSGSAHSRRHTALAANVLAPLVVGYLVWVLTTAKEIGLEHLHFENAGLLAIAQSICQQYPEQTDPSGSTANLLPACHQLSAEYSKRDRSYCFKLLEGLEESQIVSDFPPREQSDDRDSFSSRLSYIEAPIQFRQRLEGIAYLFEYSPVLQQLFCALSAADFPLYQAVVMDYVTAFLRPSLGEASPTPTPPTIDSQNNLSQSSLNMLKRYAINNAVRLLTSPTAADVNAIVELQLANTDIPSAPIRSLRPWEIPTLSKRLIKGGHRHPQVPWMEGAIALSPFPIRSFFAGMHYAKEVARDIIKP